MNNIFNEMNAPAGAVRPHYARFQDWLAQTPPAHIAQKRAEADSAFHRYGITFAVYGDAAANAEGTERLIPFDIIPRIIPAAEWDKMARGLKQRVNALNMFLHDVYGQQRIVQAGLIPAEQVFCNAQYRPEMQGLAVRNNIYAHIAGIDIVRAAQPGHGAEQADYYVLEDNLRVPSGVSYVLENRQAVSYQRSRRWRRRSSGSFSKRALE